MMEIILSLLNSGMRIVDATPVKSHGGSSFHAACFKPQLSQLLGYAVRGGFGHSPTLGLCASHVHQSIKKCASREYDTSSREMHPQGCCYSSHPSLFYRETDN